MELGIGGRVEFWGYVPDPASLLSRFDVFLMSSNYEGVPAVVLEAIAARLPVITTDCSRSMADLLQRGALGERVAVILANALRHEMQPRPVEHIHLTERERETLALIAAGYSNKLIARQLKIAEGTVKVHVKHLLHKLNLGSRVEAAVWAVTHLGESAHR